MQPIGFPYLVEVLRWAGVRRNIWWLPAWQSLYITDKGSVVIQGTPLATGMVEGPAFDRAALISALRIDQAGKVPFRNSWRQPGWPASSATTWILLGELVTYYGSGEDKYVKSYPAAEV